MQEPPPADAHEVVGDGKKSTVSLCVCVCARAGVCVCVCVSRSVTCVALHGCRNLCIPQPCWLEQCDRY